MGFSKLTPERSRGEASVRRVKSALIIGCASTVLAAAPAPAFPPYRSTDADTAGAGTVQLRLGLLRIQRRNSESQRNTPLTRTNLGVGDHYELVSEFEYSPEEHHLEEGALGFKWARPADRFGIGVETLVLLPVQSEQAGAGLESQFIATLARESWQVHFNAGRFYDPRGSETERGWRASILAEFPRGRLRPGAELFAKSTRSGERRVQAGVGVIAQLERMQVRSGLHFGLSDEAPDIEVSLWLAWSWQTRGG